MKVCNFSGEVIENPNRVTRGVANYYATNFSTVNAQFLKLYEMVRRRLI